MKSILSSIKAFFEKYQKVLLGLAALGVSAIAVVKLLDDKTKPPTK